MIKCQNCATENKDQWKFCLGCGSELPREAVAAAKRFATPTPPAGVAAPPAEPAVAARPAAPAAPPPPPPPQARTSAPASAKTAAPPPPAAAPQAASGATPCLSCGNEVPAGNIFCGRCGHRMDVPAPAKAPAAPAPAPAVAVTRGRLVLLQPDGSEGASIPLGDGPTQVGRATHHILAGDLFLSPVHMSFTFRGGQLVVQDENSLNGIFFRLAPNVPVEIHLGDSFRFGQEYLRFSPVSPPVPEPDGTVRMGTDPTDTWGRLDQVVGPDLVGNSFLCRGDRVVCGRERGHVLFPHDGYVSGAHIEIRRDGDRILLSDLQSSNGSYLRIQGRKTLAPNEILLVGQYLYRVEY